MIVARDQSKMADDRMAGMRLLQFLQTPTGEEVGEGTLGGLIAGASQLGSDQPLSQTALETAAAIAGGIGMGMLGRRIGAGLGKKIHKDPLSDQEGMVAMMARLGGNETLGEGLKQQGRQYRRTIESGLMERASQQMMQEAIENPQEFVRKYKLDPEEFKQLMPNVITGRSAQAMLKVYSEMPEESRQAFLSQFKPYLERYGAVEEAIGRNAAENMDEGIGKIRDRFMEARDADDTPEGARQVMEQMGQFTDGMLGNPVPVTGEHVGRAAGRFIGDEVGILGGMVAGSMLAQSLGIESPKDRKIRELEAKLSGRAA